MNNLKKSDDSSDESSIMSDDAEPFEDYTQKQQYGGASGKGSNRESGTSSANHSRQGTITKLGTATHKTGATDSFHKQP